MTRPKLNVRALRRLQRLITEEPRRFDFRFVWENRDYTMGWAEKYGIKPSAFPDCGTIGCFCGWLVGKPGQRSLGEAVTEIAAMRLGVPWGFARENLFVYWDPALIGELNFGFVSSGVPIRTRAGVVLKPGTKRYAAVACRYLDLFIAKYQSGGYDRELGVTQ